MWFLLIICLTPKDPAASSANLQDEDLVVVGRNGASRLSEGSDHGHNRELRSAARGNDSEDFRMMAPGRRPQNEGLPRLKAERLADEA